MSPESQQSQIARLEARMTAHIEDQREVNRALRPLTELYGRLGERIESTGRDVTSLGQMMREAEERSTARCREAEEAFGRELAATDKAWRERFDEEIKRSRFNRGLYWAAIPAVCGVLIALATFLYMVLSNA